jgi:hypothetical protein
MHCEICETIKRLGLDRSAHDLWFCSESRTCCPARPGSPRLLLRAAKWQHAALHLLAQIPGHLLRFHVCPTYRQRIITLGL